MKYRPEIDGLRAVAVLPVILFHAGYGAASGGYVGVDVFFVISGYLITSLIAAELEAGTFRLRDFYERRARRILPALFVVALACIPPAWLLLFPGDMVDFAQSLVAVATFWSNVLFWQESDYFARAAELKPLLHTWSLAVEEQYYILFPLLMMILWRWARGWVVPILALLFAASLIGAQVGSIMDPDFTFYMLPTRVWELVAGALAALWLRRRAADAAPLRGAGALALAGLGAILASVVLYDPATPFPGLYALLPVLGAVAVVLFAAPGTAAHRLLAARPLVGLGLVSYSAYLWHQPAFAFARHAGIDGHPATFPLLTILSLGLAILTWRLVETPLRRRGTVGLPALAGLGTGAAACLGAFAAFALLTAGNAARYTPEEYAIIGPKELHDRFVWPAHEAVRARPFTGAAGKTRILLIGDSGSADTLNALQAVLDPAAVEYRTLQVSKGCGNLDLPAAERQRLAGDIWRPYCADLPGYDSAIADRLITAADRVILANAWQDWEIPLLPASMKRLAARYGDKFRLIGSKRVDLDLRALLARPPGPPEDWRLPPDAHDAANNAALAQSLDPEMFIDPHTLICDARGCQALDEKGRLLIYDGFHLTESGAAWFGERLLRSGALDLPLPRTAMRR